jgi:hypothetical protein
MSAGITYTAAKYLIQSPLVSSKSTRTPSDNVPDYKGIQPIFGRIMGFSPVAPPGWKPPVPTRSLSRRQPNKSEIISTSSKSSKTPSTGSSKAAAFTVGIGIESAIAQVLTYSRFNIQRNAINSTSIKVTLQDLFKGYQFFSVARLAQFFSMTQAKEVGKAASYAHNPTASQNTHDLVGAAASSASGVLFGLPMELVLLEGVKSTHEGSVFSLKDTVKQTMSDTVRFKARGAGATALRDLPLGGFLVLGAPKIEEALTQFAQDYISAPVIKVVSVLASAAGFCVSTQGADVVKTTIQNNKQLPDKTWDVARQIYEERGIKAFKSGLCPRFSKVAITFLIFNIGVAKLEEGLSKGNF